jgi:hypothetical protein
VKESYSGGHLSFSVVNISSSYTSVKTMREPNSLLSIMVPAGNSRGFVESKIDDSWQCMCTYMFLYVPFAKAVVKQQLKWNML